MRVVFINPPIGFLDSTDLAPPLGLLTLAAFVRQRGHEVYLQDFNLEVMLHPELADDKFYEFAVDSIAKLNPDVIALTSMCMESHVSLEIAWRVKMISPNVVTVFGGTHFGSIAWEVLTHFSFVDFVVIGEGEIAIAAILDRLTNNKSGLPKNVAYRECGKIRYGEQEQVRPLLETLPFPLYDSINIKGYFTANPRHVVDYDGGRGCIFKCAFCYSPFQYGDSIRNKKPEGIISDLRRLSEIGARHIFFVQDNLLNDPQWAAELCRQITAADLPLTWSCYVTYPQLTIELIDLMASSHCIGVFTGIDAVSKNSQARMNKRFLRNWQSVKNKLALCVERGVIPTCAFILEGPDQSPEEIEDTIRTAIECRQIGCEVHVNTLSVYNGSELDRRSIKSSPAYSPMKVDLLMDAPPMVQRNDLAKQLPYIFPYHSTYSELQKWEVFLAKVHTIFAALYVFPQTLHEYVTEEDKPFWNSLIYIDTQFVSWLQMIPKQQRRLAAIQKFCYRFSSELSTIGIRRTFRREQACYTLSSYQHTRHLGIKIDGILRAYNLSWFLDISDGTENSSFSQSPMVYCRQEDFIGPQNNSRKQQDRREFVLLSQENNVKILSLGSSLARILSDCEKAASSGEAVSLNKDVVEQLEREGWIWR